MKILRTVFQDSEVRGKTGHTAPRLILVLDMEDQINISTRNIPNITHKIEYALPGIFPTADSRLMHSCGGEGTDTAEHSFREEINNGTDIPHLLEHVIMFLLSRRTYSSSAYCGQRSIDIEHGITSHYYLVFEYSSRFEAIIAVDIGYQLVTSWIEGRTVKIDPDTVIGELCKLIEPMVRPDMSALQALEA